jgi:mannose-1-phosphate guanylyltransferase
VSALTRDAGGQIVPKQYWACNGRESMVRWALARARRVAPVAGVLAVVNESHRGFWQRELADVPPPNLLIQPRNRGTAVGVILALLDIQAKGGADSPVVFLPSDHYVGDEVVLHRTMQEAVRAVRRSGPAVVLLGMTPVDADGSYGWILPATREPVAPVLDFVEKPPVETVSHLMSRGALVNSFIIVARTRILLSLIGRARPDVVTAFHRARRRPAASLGTAELYEEIPPVDLSKDVLEREAQDLYVTEVPSCGWSDLGTPERLQRFLGQPSMLRASCGVSTVPASAA